MKTVVTLLDHKHPACVHVLKVFDGDKADVETAEAYAQQLVNLIVSIAAKLTNRGALPVDLEREEVPLLTSNNRYTVTVHHAGDDGDPPTTSTAEIVAAYQDGAGDVEPEAKRIAAMAIGMAALKPDEVEMADAAASEEVRRPRHVSAPEAIAQARASKSDDTFDESDLRP